MIKEAILKPIGKGQITLPIEWRKALGINKKNVIAKLAGNKIIIESIKNDKLEWDIKKISLNNLNEDLLEEIKSNINNYENLKTEKFISHNEFWENV